MVASFEAVPYAQFHTRELQKEILSRWHKLPSSLVYQIQLSHLVKSSLVWWLTSPVLRTGKSFLPCHWTVVTTDASLSVWGT